jgi:protein required for attachment to host cells
MPNIPHNALIVVGDGQKAIFLRNEGDARFPNLVTETVLENVNPPSREQGTDRPGRVHEALRLSGRSAVDATDWHDIGEHRFARTIAASIERMVRSGEAKALILVAPPRTLAVLRSSFHPETRASIILEVNKDLTRSSVWDIEKHLTGAN